jgi:hypothetical protein
MSIYDEINNLSNLKKVISGYSNQSICFTTQKIYDENKI